MEQMHVTDEVVLLDELGREERFLHVLTFLYEGERYVALEPAQQDDDDEEAEVIILRAVNEDGQDTYVSVDNEILLEEVFEEFLSLMDEVEGE